MEQAGYIYGGVTVYGAGEVYIWRRESVWSRWGMYIYIYVYKYIYIYIYK